MIKFQCAGCAKLFSVETDFLGKEILCPHCQNLLNLPSSRIACGAVLGEFIIRKKIATWEKGRIYDAVQISLDRHVALKVLFPEHTTEESIKDFIDEARKDAQMKIPHAGQVFMVGQDSGIYYCPMENVNTENTNTTTFMREIIIEKTAGKIGTGFSSNNIQVAKPANKDSIPQKPQQEPGPQPSVPISKPSTSKTAEEFPQIRPPQTSVLPPRPPGTPPAKPLKSPVSQKDGEKKSPTNSEMKKSKVINTGKSNKPAIKAPASKPKPTIRTKVSMPKIQFKIKK